MAYEISALPKVGTSGDDVLGSTEFPVSEMLRDQRNPDVASLAGGGFVVAYTSSALRSGTSYWEYPTFQIYGADGQKIGQEVRVESNVGNTQGYNAFAAGLGDGSFMIFWRHWPGAGTRSDIYAKHFDANGDVLRETFLVSTQVIEHQFWGGVAELADGGVIATWHDVVSLNKATPNLQTIAFKRFGSDGEPIHDTVPAGQFEPGRTYEIATLGNTDFTQVGAGSNTAGLKFIATGPGSGTGTTYADNILNVDVGNRGLEQLRHFTLA